MPGLSFVWAKIRSVYMTGTEINQELQGTLNTAGELTPITINEARKVLGQSSEYSSGETLAMAVLDFTAIARAYLRNIPKFEVLKPTKVRYN